MDLKDVLNRSLQYEDASTQVRNILLSVLEAGELTQSDNDLLEALADKYTENYNVIKNLNAEMNETEQKNKLDELDQNKLSANMEDLVELLTQGGRNCSVSVDSDGRLIIDDKAIPKLQLVELDVEKLYADYAEITQLVADKATIKDLEATNASIENLKADIGDFQDLTALKADIKELQTDYAEIEQAVIGKASADELEAVKATIKDLDVSVLRADLALIEQAVIKKADITDLDALHAEIDFLESDIADIETLVGGHLTMDNIQSLILSSDKVTVANAFIKDAMIDSINANKINAGSIDTNLVKLQSSDGSMVINGSLQQFKDKEGNVRIQIGKDASGDFTFALYGANGQGQLINQDGIQASAISDGLIVDDMVASDANIDASKLNINSVVREINNGTETIKGTKVVLDENNQTLDIAFNTLNTTATEAADKINNLQVGGTNVIRNYAFLQGTEFWKFNNSSATIDTKFTFNGHPTLKCTQSGLTADKWTGGTNRYLPEHNLRTMRKGETWTASMWYYVADKSTLDGPIGLEVKAVKVGGASQSTIISGRVDTAKIEEGKWARLVVTGTMQNDYEQCAVSGWIARNGTAWLADFQLEPGNVATPASVCQADIDAQLAELDSVTASHTTQLDISQGQISTLIANTTITKTDGSTVQLKDEYSSTVNTVNQMSAKLGTLTTTVSDNKKAVDSQMSEVTHTLEEIGGSLIDISEDVTTVSDGLKTTNTRVAKAESKLTKDGLTTIIGSHYTTSEEVEGKITSKGYATSSEVTQTKTDVIYRFEESGGYNILYNSDFRRDLAHWSLTSGASYSFLNSCDTPNGRAIRILGVSGESKYLAQNITDTKYLNAKNYTLSSYIRVNSTGSGGTNEYYRVYARLTYSDGTKTYHYAYNADASKTTYDKWHRVNVSFKRDTTKVLTEIRYGIETKDNTNYLDIAQAMFQVGGYLTSWSCNPNEAYDGIITIDNNGVKVEQSSYSGYTQMKNDGFYVNNGTENVISITANESIFRGKVIVQSGSTVPTSVLSGTISSTQLNESITNDISTAKTNASNAVTTANTANSTANTAKSTANTANTNASTALSTANTAKTNASTALSTANTAKSTADTANTNASSALSTANSVKSTLDSNKTNWSNAYNRVAQWAYGAVTGNTTIDGGYIQANTISANKLAVGDFNNYATVNEYLPVSMLPSTFRYGGTEIKTGTTQCVASASSTKQYIMMCDFTKTAFNRYDEIYVEGYLYSHHTETQRVRCSVWGYDADKTFVSGTTASYMVDLPPKVWTKVSGTIKLTDTNWGTKNVVYHLVGVIINNSDAALETNLYARAFSFRRKTNGELIVDGSITAEKIAADSITADKIAGQTIEGITIKGCLIESSREIAFDGGARMFGTTGEFGAGLQISTPSFSLPHTSSGTLAGDWTLSNGSLTVNKALTVGTTLTASGAITANSTLTAKGVIYGMNNIALARGSLHAPNGTKTRDYVRFGSHILQSDSDFSGILLTDAEGTYAKLACLRAEVSGDVTCNSLWASTKVYAGNIALTSDERLKTDIRYVNAGSQSLGSSGLISPNVNLTTADMHEFIETIPLASFRMIAEVEQGIDYTYYGFIAQDILYSKVGSELVEYSEVITDEVTYDEEGKEIITPKVEERLRYSENKFIAFICGALKEEIAQRKALERKIDELSNIVIQLSNL